jgi:DNA-binding CsgD family transcriptional regulator
MTNMPPVNEIAARLPGQAISGSPAAAGPMGGVSPDPALDLDGSDTLERNIRSSVVAALRDMLTKAEQGPLELSAVAGAGLTVVLEHQNVRCMLVVEVGNPNPGLSPRELQIARLVADGATNRAIARTLDISLWTVSTHLRRVFAKVGVCSRAEMVAHLFGAPHLPLGG